MQTLHTIAELRTILGGWRSAALKIALVPTMGNLHAGHIKLVEKAKELADKVVVSIFVNPTQFGVGEDFNTYPRTINDDSQKLLDAATDVLFLPSTSEIYSATASTVISVKPLSVLQCGAFRPGHFDGVATVVGKLFNIVQPMLAVFGLKDYQQFLIIQTMVNDLNFPIELIGVETVRENNGLAMSSRNAYLSASEREIAAKLYQCLCHARDEVLKSDKTFCIN